MMTRKIADALKKYINFFFFSNSENHNRNKNSIGVILKIAAKIINRQKNNSLRFKKKLKAIHSISCSRMEMLLAIISR